MKLVKTGLFLSKKKKEKFPKHNQELVIKYIIWLIIRFIRLSGRGQVPRSPDKRRSTVLVIEAI